jgi:poly-beta-1,6-N-acetyl-D-glucosamine synthase
MTSVNILFWVNLFYFLALEASYFLLVWLSARQVSKYNRSITYAEFHRIAQSPLTTPVSLIIPAYNEETIIVNMLQNVLMLDFPCYEVIVVNDGSRDKTLAALIEAFKLRRVERCDPKPLETEEVLGVYQSLEHPKLVVVDKKNGRRADTINAGANFARHPLLCVIDADCILETDILLHMVRPFLRDPEVAAAAGIVRPSNGLTVKNGKILHRGLPRSLLGMNQEVEYARSFQWARLGLCRLESMLCISGALMMIKRSVFLAIGGSSASALTDDIEFTIRLNAHIYDRTKTRDAKLAFVPDAICYTEVPGTLSQYASQRNRWTRGTLEALWRNWRMFFNPRYGMTGLYGMPFFVLFEAFSAIVEIFAYISIVTFLLLGTAKLWEILLMLSFAYTLNIFLTLSAVLMTETSRFRTPDWRSLWKLLLAAFLDTLGFHQFHLIARVVGTYEYLFFGRRDFGAPMKRMAQNASPP